MSRRLLPRFAGDHYVADDDIDLIELQSQKGSFGTDNRLNAMFKASRWRTRCLSVVDGGGVLPVVRPASALGRRAAPNATLSPLAVPFVVYSVIALSSRRPTKAYSGLVGRLFERTRKKELVQALHQIRPVLANPNGDGPTKHAYLLTNVPTEI